MTSPRRRLFRIRHPSGTTGADPPKLGIEDLKGFQYGEGARVGRMGAARAHMWRRS
jgi:hypothetical protein